MTLELLRHNLRLAWRGLWRTPGFSGVAAGILAVGMAGVIVMFAIIEGVLLRPLPVREEARVVVAWNEVPGRIAHLPFLVEDVEAIGRNSRLLERVAGVGYNGALSVVVVEDGHASNVRIAPVTPDFFRVLGVDPVLGRALGTDADRRGAEDVLVISRGLWARRYGGAANVIGRQVRIGERPFTIVGVMPADLDHPHNVEAWVAVSSFARTTPDPNFRVDLDLVARLRDDVMPEQAAAELHSQVRQLEGTVGLPPAMLSDLVPVVRPLRDVVVGDADAALVALFAAVALVLLIAAANVGNLLLLRSEARRTEFALRAALGAGRGQLAAQLLAESLVLALVAAFAALLLTWWSLPALLALVPEGLPRADGIRVDPGTVVFSVALASVTALVSVLIPACAVMGGNLVRTLREAGRGIVSSSARRSRRGLVVAQVALAVIVLTATGLVLQSLRRLQGLDIGLAADRLVFMQLDVPQAKYADRQRLFQFLEQTADQLEATPDVEAVTPVMVPPFAGTGGWDLPRFTAEGQDELRALANPSLNLEAVFPDYFDTFRIPVIRGRSFVDTDLPGAPSVAIVSEDVAARTWPFTDPVGRRIKFGPPDSKDEWLTIVGVARATRYRELAEPRPSLYLPAAQFVGAPQMLVLRTTASTARLADVARGRIAAVDPGVRIARIATFEEFLGRPLARPRFNAFLLTVFGGAALLLATVGLYAVMAAYVRQQQTEIGVRVALGAPVALVRFLVVREGLALAVAGVVLGLVVATQATQAIRGLLFQVSPLDVASLGFGAVLLITTAVAASWMPARRATRVDPSVLLRSN
jgi:predicted permease